MLPFFLEKASRRISQGVGGVIWEESHNVPPARSQAWVFQSQITNIMDYRRSLHMQRLFAVRPAAASRAYDLSASFSLTFIDRLLPSMSRGP